MALDQSTLVGSTRAVIENSPRQTARGYLNPERPTLALWLNTRNRCPPRYLIAQSLASAVWLAHDKCVRCRSPSGIVVCSDRNIFAWFAVVHGNTLRPPSLCQQRRGIKLPPFVFCVVSIDHEFLQRGLPWPLTIGVSSQPVST